MFAVYTSHYLFPSSEVQTSLLHYRSNVPYVLHGESGYGKTSLLAVASSRVYEWLGDHPDLVVVRRFLGTTPDSTNIGSLLGSVCKQITISFG